MQRPYSDVPLPREGRIQALVETTFDVLVVGAGITGCGVARDAALRGLKVALIDKDDYASGTSSKSSKMVHGGLRYLEDYNFRLVFESLRERAVQRRLNPHLVWPFPYVFPVYKGDRNPLWKINLGLWLYDALALFRSHKLHKKLSPAKTVAKVPGLRMDGMSGSVFYYDCRTDDARLTLANALSAERVGAVAVNYLRYDAPTYDQEAKTLTGAKLTDALSGESLAVTCRHIIYCGGPWTDTLEHAAGGGKLLRRTKGIHMVVPRERFPIDELIPAVRTPDQRPCFAVPFGDCVYIGTTDTDYNGDLDAIEPTADDIAYLLDTINDYFPEVRLTAKDVRSTWAGLRPLVLDDDVSDASKTSREHLLLTDIERGVTTIAGGKLTTYRSMAQEVVDAAVDALSRSPDASRPGRCTTHKVALDPDLPPESNVDGEFERMLWRHHGSAMEWVRSRMRSHPAEAKRIVEDSPSLDYVMAQVSWAVLGEHAVRLEDVLIRRLHVFYRATDQGRGVARRVACHMASLLGRHDAWIAAEVERYEALIDLSRRGARELMEASDDLARAPGDG